MASWPFSPPITPMEAKVAEALPEQGDWAFEPKWDGFRAIAWSGEVAVQRPPPRAAAPARDRGAAPLQRGPERLVGPTAGLPPPWPLTPSTTDRATALRWFDEFEAAGCDGIVAKRLPGPYVGGKRGRVK